MLLTLLAAAVPLAPVRARQDDVTATLDRVARRVLAWYDKAQTIVSTEDVLITPLRYDMAPLEPSRRLTFDLRVAWEPGGDGPLPRPTVLRDLVKVNGRAPRPKDEPGCMDPKPATPEPLMILLPEERGAFAFRNAGTARIDGRRALLIDYRGIGSAAPDVTWTDDCVSVSLPGRTRGRIWVDAETYDVLRLDESLMGLLDLDVPAAQQRRGAARSLVFERADSSIRYRRVEFQDPPEVLMVPSRVETVTVARGSGMIRTRVTQRYSGHRRFLSDVRILP